MLVLFTLYRTLELSNYLFCPPNYIILSILLQIHISIASNAYSITLNRTLFIAVLRSRCGHYIFALWFLLLLSSFFLA